MSNHEIERRQFAETRDDFLRASCDVVWETDRNLILRLFERTGPLQPVMLTPPPIGASLPTLVSELGSAFEAVLARRRPFRFVQARWENHPFLLSGVPVFSTDGRFQGYRGVAVEDEAKEASNPASHFVQEYQTIALELNDARWALGECQRRLAQRDDAEASLLHELKTPLNAAVGYAELGRRRLEAAVDSHQVQAALDNVSEALEHLTDLVGRAGDAHHGSPDQKCCQTQTRVNDIVRAAYRLMHPIATAAEVDLEGAIHGVPEDRTVNVGTRSLTQMLINLLANAVKFTPAGGRCGCRVLDTATGSLRISVWDTGPGIATEEQARVFERYYRVPVAVTADGMSAVAGKGLGLSISQEIARSAGGDLTVESTPGQGATFHLDLPRSQG